MPDQTETDHQHWSRRPSSPLSMALWNFSSQWFLIPQGTGIIAVILRALDYQFNGLHTLAMIVWIYTMVLYGACLLAYLLRIALYPTHVAHEIRTNIAETSCLSSISISFSSIIAMVALQYGRTAGLASYVLWWVNAAMAVAACIGIPYVQLKLQPPGIKRVPPSILLAVIAALTSAAVGGVVCRYGHISDRLRVPAVIVSYLVIGAAITLATSFNVIVLFQHFDQSHPSTETVFQDMILCGPHGQGSFALQILGDVVDQGCFAGYNRGTFLTAKAGTPIAFASQFGGLLSWGYATFWWCFAIISISHTLVSQEGGLKKTKFSIAVWSLIFPWGVYTNAAVQMGKLMEGAAFKVWSTALFLILLVMWILVQLLTIRGIVTGKILGLEHGWRRISVEYADSIDHKRDN